MELDQYRISTSLGFLSSIPPITHFTDPVYQPWDDLIGQLSTLLSSKTLDQHVHKLAILSTDNLTSELEWQRAYVALAFIIHGFIWSSQPPRTTIPPQLSEPFIKVCKHLGLEPVLSYAGLCLWNWRTKSRGSLGPSDAVQTLKSLDKLDCIGSFTGTKDEMAFYVVPDMVEAAGGHLPALLLQAVQTVQECGQFHSIKFRNNVTAVVMNQISKTLDDCAEAFVTMSHMLSVLTNDTCNPDVFFNEIRPWLAGSSSLPDGLTFELSNGNAITGVKCAGGSAVQSALFPVIDAMLGIKHENDMFREMRAYMPGSHREFLSKVSQMQTIGDFVVALQSTNENQAALDVNAVSRLTHSYDGCLEALRKWRTKHIALVTRYIVLPARKAENMKKHSRAYTNEDGNTNGDFKLDATTQNGVDKDENKALDEMQGTGGSALMPFLKQARDETAARKSLESPKLVPRPNYENGI